MSIIKANRWESSSGSLRSTVLQTQYVASGTRVQTTHTTMQEPSTAYRVTITPQFASSMILLTYHLPFNQNSSQNVICVMRAFRIIGGGSKQYNLTSSGASNGSRQVVAGGAWRPGNGYDNNDQQTETFTIIDFPNTTSSIVYGFETRPESANTTSWGYTATDTGSWGYDTDIVITAQEIAQ
jgi:hypothetical protein